MGCPNMRKPYFMLNIYESLPKIEGVSDSQNGNCLMYTYTHIEIRQPKLMMLYWCFVRYIHFAVTIL